LLESSCILSLLTTNPVEISSVKSDNIFGALIDKIEPAIAKINATNITALKPCNSLNNLFIALLKSFAFSPAPAPGPPIGPLGILLGVFSLLFSIPHFLIPPLIIVIVLFLYIHHSFLIALYVFPFLQKHHLLILLFCLHSLLFQFFVLQSN